MHVKAYIFYHSPLWLILWLTRFWRWIKRMVHFYLCFIATIPWLYHNKQLHRFFSVYKHHKEISKNCPNNFYFPGDFSKRD